MKQILSITWKVILNAILVVIAVTLLKYLLIPAVIVTLFLAFFKRKVGNGFLNVAQYFRQVAVSIDQLGNVVCADLFNTVLIKKGGYKFGNPDETISSALGKNQRLDKLTKVGKILNWILSKIEKDHSLISIEEDETNPLK